MGLLPVALPEAPWVRPSDRRTPSGRRAPGGGREWAASPPLPGSGSYIKSQTEWRSVPLPGPLSHLDGPTLLLIGLIGGLAGAYLVAVPLALYWWMGQRWTRMGKIERTAVYGLVFLFFPGLILFAPFLNFRLQGQGESAA